MNHNKLKSLAWFVYQCSQSPFTFLSSISIFNPYSSYAHVLSLVLSLHLTLHPSVHLYQFILLFLHVYCLTLQFSVNCHHFRLLFMSSSSPAIMCIIRLSLLFFRVEVSNVVSCLRHFVLFFYLFQDWWMLFIKLPLEILLAILFTWVLTRLDRFLLRRYA